MPCKSALLSIIQRQTEGVMYHDQMTDYYAFLHLDKLKELHHERTKEELCSLRKVKCDYINALGLAGIMYWQYGQDVNDMLSNAIDKYINA
jgi:hypothetical protein